MPILPNYCFPDLSPKWIISFTWPPTGIWTFPGGSASKEPTGNAGDLGSIPGLGRSPEEGNSYPPSVFWTGEFYALHDGIPW